MKYLIWIVKEMGNVYPNVNVFTWKVSEIAVVSGMTTVTWKTRTGDFASKEIVHTDVFWKNVKRFIIVKILIRNGGILPEIISQVPSVITVEFTPWNFPTKKDIVVSALPISIW